MAICAVNQEALEKLESEMSDESEVDEELEMDEESGMDELEVEELTVRKEGKEKKTWGKKAKVSFCLYWFAVNGVATMFVSNDQK